MRIATTGSTGRGPHRLQHEALHRLEGSERLEGTLHGADPTSTAGAGPLAVPGVRRDHVLPREVDHDGGGSHVSDVLQSSRGGRASTSLTYQGWKKTVSIFVGDVFAAEGRLHLATKSLCIKKNMWSKRWIIMNLFGPGPDFEAFGDPPKGLDCLTNVYVGKDHCLFWSPS